MKKVAFVTIEMVNEDAIIIQKTTSGDLLSTVTMAGGLFSLYAGFSSLSFAEILFWALRSVIRMLLQRK